MPDNNYDNAREKIHSCVDALICDDKTSISNIVHAYIDELEPLLLEGNALKDDISRIEVLLNKIKKQYLIK